MTTEVKALQLGDIAPDFEQESTVGKINFHEWASNSWVILFSHPKDYTPVCTTELGAVSKLKSEFDKRGVKAIGLSVDPLADHKAWTKDIEETQNCQLNFPLLADGDRKVSSLYGMIHPNANDSFTVRSVYIIDPNKKVRLIITYPASSRMRPMANSPVETGVRCRMQAAMRTLFVATQLFGRFGRRRRRT